MHKERLIIIVSKDAKWYRFGDMLRIATNFGSDRYFDLWFPVHSNRYSVIDRVGDSVRDVLIRHGITSDKDMEYNLHPVAVGGPTTGFSMEVVYTCGGSDE